MKSQFSYNPKVEYSYETAENVVKELQKQGFKAERYMGISQMKIHTNAPLILLTDLVWEVWCKECDNE